MNGTAQPTHELRLLCWRARGVGSVSSTIVFQGFLYALWVSVQDFWKVVEQEIWKYNIGADAWEKVMWTSALPRSTLLTSSGAPTACFGLDGCLIS